MDGRVDPSPDALRKLAEEALWDRWCHHMAHIDGSKMRVSAFAEFVEAEVASALAASSARVKELEAELKESEEARGDLCWEMAELRAALSEGAR